MSPRRLDPLPLTLLVLALVGGVGAAVLGDGLWPLLVLVVMLALIGGTMLTQRARRRSATLREWAGRNGWTPVAAPSLPGGVATEVYGRSYRGFAATSLTWTPTEQRRRSRTVRHLIVLELPGGGPPMQLTPRSLASALDLMPEAPTGDPEFDAVWHVGTTEPGAVRLDDQLRGRLLREDARSQVLRFEGGTAVSWEVGPSDVERVLPRLAALWAVADLLGRTTP